MKIKNEYPPNFIDINLHFPYKDGYVYCYGDTIYNPSGKDIPEDIIFHEAIHSKQQGEKPEIWWKLYIYDSKFREDMELEAYAKQYKFVKENYPAKAHKEALDEFANNLQKMYNINTPIEKLKTKIRKYGRKN